MRPLQKSWCIQTLSQRWPHHHNGSLNTKGLELFVRLLLSSSHSSTKTRNHTKISWLFTSEAWCKVWGVSWERFLGVLLSCFWGTLKTAHLLWETKTIVIVKIRQVECENEWTFVVTPSIDLIKRPSPQKDAEKIKERREEAGIVAIKVQAWPRDLVQLREGN